MVVHLRALEELLRRERRDAVRHPLTVLVLILEHIDDSLADDTLAVLTLADDEADVLELMRRPVNEERAAELLEGRPHPLVGNRLCQHLVPQRALRILGVAEIQDYVSAVFVIVSVDLPRIQVKHAVLEHHVSPIRDELAPLLVLQ